MRILAIRGENLASLAGAFALELEAPPLGGQGLVAVTGPTGAGKSTLLDALCLALFDRTPRLRGRGGSVVGFAQPEDREVLTSADPRCLIRRGAVEARAEVEFLGKLGRRYLATWRVRRARRAATGRIQEQSLELVDLTLGQRVGGHRKGDVLAAIQEALGLDWAAFGRAALLAQGEFAAFLRADAGGRAALLERITGTGLYSRISVAAHRRAGDAARALAAWEERRGALRPLPDEVRAALLGRREALRGEREAARAAGEAAREALRQQRALEEARREEQRAAAALSAAEQAWGDAAPLREALAELERLEPLRAPLAARDRAAAACEALEADARAATAAARDARESHQRRAAQAEAARAWLATRERWRLLGEQWPRWEALLLECRDAAAARRQADADAPRVRERRERAAARVAEARQSVVAAEEARERAMAEHLAARAALPGRAGEARRALAAAERALAALAPARERAERAAQAVACAAGEAELAAAEAARVRAALEALAGELPVALARRDEARRAWAAARAALDLEAHRSELRAGEPCPLCGAVEHPWVEEAPPLQGLAGAAGARLEELERALEVAQAARRRGEAELAAAEVRLQAATQLGAAQAADLTAARARWGALREELGGARVELLPSPPALPADPVDPAAAGALEAAREAHAGAHERLRSAEQGEEEARERLERTRAAVERAREELARDEEADRAAEAAQEAQRRAWEAAEERGRAVEEQLAAALDAPPASGDDGASEELPLFARRRPAPATPLGEPWREQLRRDPAAFLAARRDEARQWQARAASLQEAEQALGPAATAAGAAEARQEERRAAQARAQTELASREAELRQLACQAGLTPDPAAAWARLRLTLERDPAWATRTRGELARLERRGHEAATRLELLRLRRVELGGRAPAPPAEGAPAPELALDEAGAREAAAAEALLRVETDLAQDQRTREALAATVPEREARQAAATTWGELGELLGSHDGRKLRVFAQGLGLDALLEHTNAYLERLAPRYRLLRAPGQDLELQLLDRDLGDEVRPVSGLSGGESFLVSLGLALGLSSLHAGGTRIESLFIDEGLGSLDPLAQEQALATLDALQADGRQVVLITHLPGIAERLGPGVRVVPQAQGRSQVLVG